MTLTEAKRIVTHAAYAWANGSTESAQILEAIKIVLHDGEEQLLLPAQDQGNQ